ncbi:unnamed protein product, partial [Prorocentrum cordatum]
GYRLRGSVSRDRLGILSCLACGAPVQRGAAVAATDATWPHINIRDIGVAMREGCRGCASGPEAQSARGRLRGRGADRAQVRSQNKWKDTREDGVADRRVVRRARPHSTATAWQSSPGNQRESADDGLREIENPCTMGKAKKLGQRTWWPCINTGIMEEEACAIIEPFDWGCAIPWGCDRDEPSLGWSEWGLESKRSAEILPPNNLKAAVERGLQ